MKRTLLFVLALAVIPVGVDAQVTGLDPDLEETLVLADQGDAFAQYDLGLIYATGLGAPEDDVEAVRWFRLAAEQGIARAQFYLGGAYAYGEGVPEDDVEAVRW